LLRCPTPSVRYALTDGQLELLVVSERTHRIEEPSDLRGRLRFDQPVLHDGPLPGSKAGPMTARHAPRKKPRDLLNRCNNH